MARKTIKDIARESGYSTGTVSRVLNNTGPVSDTAKKRIREVVDQYHFQLNPNAKFLKQEKPTGIAVIIKGTNNLLFTSLVELLQERIEKAGFEASVYYLQEDEDEVQEAIEICSRRLPKGILFLGSFRHNFLNRFRSVPVPSVLVTNSAEGLGYPNLGSVSTDDAGAAQCAVDYLISLGHEKIAILGGNFSQSQAALSRFQGAQYAFFDHDLHFDPALQYQEGLFSIEAGYDGMLKLLEKMPDVTAVFAMADVMAIGAVRAIRDKGLRVPEDISVVGFDGIELSHYLTPRLTTVSQNQQALAEQSLEMLISMIDDDVDGSFLELPYDLCEGESCSPLCVN